jgi:hypothetical protein
MKAELQSWQEIRNKKTKIKNPANQEEAIETLADRAAVDRAQRDVWRKRELLAYTSMKRCILEAKKMAPQIEPQIAQQANHFGFFQRVQPNQDRVAARQEAEKGLNVHIGDRDERTKAGLFRLREINRTRKPEFDPNLCFNYILEVVEKIASSTYPNKDKALQVIRSQNGAFPALINDARTKIGFGMTGIEAFGQICFSILQRKGTTLDTSIQSLIKGLNEGYGYCVQGKIQKVMVAAIQGYEDVMIDDLAKAPLTAQNMTTLFFEDERNRGEEGQHHTYVRSERYLLSQADLFIKELKRNGNTFVAGAETGFLDEVNKFCEVDERPDVTEAPAPRRTLK